MYKLYLTLLFCIIIAPFIYAPQFLACGEDTPLYTHFSYMFAHANFLHWVINSWAMVVFHNIIKWYRLSIAYSLSVIVSFLPLGLSVPLVGLSVITFFFVGFTAVYFYHTKRFAFYTTLFILALGLFLPHIAGWHHVIMFVLGIATWKTETFIKNNIYAHL